MTMERLMTEVILTTTAATQPGANGTSGAEVFRALPTEVVSLRLIPLTMADVRVDGHSRIIR